MTLPESFSGWRFRLAYTPDAYFRIRSEDDKDYTDLSEHYHYLTFVDWSTHTINVNVKRMSDVSIDHIEGIVNGWETAPDGVVDRILQYLREIDLSQVDTALRIFERILNLIVKHAGPVLEFFEGVFILSLMYVGSQIA